ncbi:UNKNOWN [Stylonychia lemnae]|uniref:Uncharacterized protein n=1 Tax=Stylonychia lemnae TaxID=5949 RepID=A0A077ZRI8_STYLE|nr:UNKNOWN [Stylonychia lemnae]|eukprot:CDW72079.1 UNKNOWN [Stylonychia lemnae]
MHYINQQFFTVYRIPMTLATGRTESGGKSGHQACTMTSLELRNIQFHNQHQLQWKLNFERFKLYQTGSFFNKQVRNIRISRNRFCMVQGQDRGDRIES